MFLCRRRYADEVRFLANRQDLTLWLLSAAPGTCASVWRFAEPTSAFLSGCLERKLDQINDPLSIDLGGAVCYGGIGAIEADSGGLRRHWLESALSSPVGYAQAEKSQATSPSWARAEAEQ